MKCINCYRKIDENLKFCNFCGAKQPVDREAYEREHPELANALPEEELLEQKQEHQRQIMELKLRQEELERQIRQVTEHLEQEQKTTVAQPNVAATIASTSSEDVKAATGQPNAAVNESVERERSAMGNAGYNFPRKAVVINTSPSNPEKISDTQKQTERSKMPEVKVPIPASSNTSASAHKPIYPRDKRILFLAIGIAIGLSLGVGLVYYFSNDEEKITYDQAGNQDDAIIEDSENVILEDSIEDPNKSMPRMDRGNASQQEAVRPAIEQENQAIEQARQAAERDNQQGGRQNTPQTAAQQQRQQQPRPQKQQLPTQPRRNGDLEAPAQMRTVPRPRSMQQQAQQQQQQQPPQPRPQRYQDAAPQQQQQQAQQQGHQGQKGHQQGQQGKLQGQQGKPQGQQDKPQKQASAFDL